MASSRQSHPSANTSSTVTLGSHSIEVTEHAVEQFQLRIRPGLDRAAAQVELVRLIRVGTIERSPPAWLETTMGQRSCCYLMIGTDMVLPLDPSRRDREHLAALTCLAPNGRSKKRRKRRRP